MTEVPPGVVTVTSIVPLPAGLVAVICVSLLTLTLLAAVCPKETLVAPVKAVPVMKTGVPPVPGPLAGLILVTVGIAPGVTTNLTVTVAFPPFEVILIVPV